MDEKEFLRLSNDENLICESQTIESNNSVVFLILKKGDKYEKIIANKIRIKRNKR